MRGIDGLDDDYSCDREYDQPKSSLVVADYNHSQESMERFHVLPTRRKEPISRFTKLHPEGRFAALSGAGTDRAKLCFAGPGFTQAPLGTYSQRSCAAAFYPDGLDFTSQNGFWFSPSQNSVPPRLAKVVAQIISALGVKAIKPVSS